MKKIYVLFSILMLWGSMASAQSYSITPATKNVSGNVYFGNTLDVEIRFDNTTAGLLFLGYKTLSNTLDPNWTITLCDWQTCYPFIPTGLEEMDTIFPGGHGFLKLSVTASSGISNGCTVYEVYDLNSSQKDTVTLCANVMGVGVDQDLSNSVLISPNPSASTVQITAVEGLLKEGTISITNLAGQVIYTENSPAVKMVSIPLSNCESGIYFLNYETTAGRVVRKIQVMK